MFITREIMGYVMTFGTNSSRKNAPDTMQHAAFRNLLPWSYGLIQALDSDFSSTTNSQCEGRVQLFLCTRGVAKALQLKCSTARPYAGAATINNALIAQIALLRCGRAGMEQRDS